MDPVEARLAHPFYLKMTGWNALSDADALWDELICAGQSATEAEVRQLLAPDHWRPVVMGAWFSLKFDQDQVGMALEGAIDLCRGTLTAPPLSVAAALVIGEDAVPTLLDYIERDRERQYGAGTFVAAVVEKLGGDAMVSADDGDRDLVSMLDIARRLRGALTAD